MQRGSNRAHHYFATTAIGFPPHKAGMRGRPCLWGKKKEKSSEGGNDELRVFKIGMWT
jgi:hypothetical protein